MNTTPDVSVVMSVYNGEKALPATLQSVLSQEDCNFELIVIDDGSTDSSGRILAECAALDTRVDVIVQTNCGLTQALIRGCNQARGEFIARQDCGDVSLPGRLASQVAALRAQPDASLVACGTRFVGPNGEGLQEVTRPGLTLQEGLSVLDINKIKGPPSHGSTMFRRAAYQTAGGYRPQFVVAQDIDLWLRLAERGQCIGQSDVAYLVSVDAGGISGRRRADQIRLASLAVACAQARRVHGNDKDVLGTVLTPTTLPSTMGPLTRNELARHYYFVGSSLRHIDPAAAKRYFRQAAIAKPTMLRALWRSLFG